MHSEAWNLQNIVDLTSSSDAPLTNSVLNSVWGVVLDDYLIDMFKRYIYSPCNIGLQYDDEA
jgi:hypothetical protein